jgi:RNA polymerase sigma-70 factor (ECF subfamily)
MDAKSPVDLIELLSRTADGDRASFRKIYAHAAGRLFALCLRMLRNREEAEDVLQEAFIKIWERSYLYDPAKGEAMAWLAAITRNAALDRLRKPGRNSVPYDEAVIDEIDSHMAALDPGSASDLRHCLEKLREDYRKVVVLAYVNGMAHDELSVLLGCPVGTVKSWVRRGLEQLKGCLGP